jgi:hypothetical protein
MKQQEPFRTLRLIGRPPSPQDATLYRRLFGARGGPELERNLQDFGRYALAPWTLRSAGADAGVGGFRIGFGQDEGLELVLTLRPDSAEVGLAAEFLGDALLFAKGTLRADRVFCIVRPQSDLSARMLSGRGFVETSREEDRRLMQWRAASAPAA